MFEVSVALHAFTEMIEYQRKLSLSQAWHTAALTRTTDAFPSLQKLLNGKRRQMTAAQIDNVFKLMSKN